MTLVSIRFFLPYSESPAYAMVLFDFTGAMLQKENNENIQFHKAFE